ncbi:MAG: hypothetical protein RL091_2131 [Verrucomicrobiota bacterium]|jgi:hypothetical protein
MAPKAATLHFTPRKQPSGLAIPVGGALARNVARQRATHMVEPGLQPSPRLRLAGRTGWLEVRCLGFFAALLSGALAQAADLPTPAIGVKDQLVFSDDFDRAGLGPALKSPIPAFTVADGLLKGHQERADHGGTLAAVLPLPDGNTIIEIKFRFAGARSFNLACDDVGYRGTHAGHISRVRVRPDLITLYDDKEGVMRNDIYALRRSGDPQKKAEGERLAEKAIVNIPVKLEQNRWYAFALELVGDRMRVSIDGQSVGQLQSPGLAHATKPNLRLSTWGSTPAQETHFDDLRVWSVKTTVGSN